MPTFDLGTSLHAISNNLLLIFSGVAGLLVYWQVHSKRRRQRTAIAVAQLAETGLLDAAAELLNSLSCDKEMSLHSQAALAHLHLRRGQLGFAVSLLTAQSSGAGWALRRSSEDMLAYAFAVGGDLERADRHWSLTARLREPISPLGCLLLCKRGRFAELVELRDRSRLHPKTATAYVPAFDWHRERVVALLSAFAYANDSNQSASSASRIDELLETGRPTFSGEYDYLVNNWPELRSFVTGQGTRLRVKFSDRVRARPPRVSIVRESVRRAS